MLTRDDRITIDTIITTIKESSNHFYLETIIQLLNLQNTTLDNTYDTNTIKKIDIVTYLNILESYGELQLVYTNKTNESELQLVYTNKTNESLDSLIPCWVIKQ